MRDRARAVVIGGGVGGCSLPLPRPLEGNADKSGADRFCSSMRDAIAALEGSTMARAAFGDQVVHHYRNYARTERAPYDKTVTDWERSATSSAGRRACGSS